MKTAESQRTQRDLKREERRPFHSLCGLRVSAVGNWTVPAREKEAIEMMKHGILADIVRVLFSMAVFVGILASSWMLVFQGVD